jgi:iduronate 2-sulfatase
MIISYPTMAAPGKSTRAMVETLDIFPTLCELAGLKPPADLDGTSLKPLLDNPAAKGHPAFAYKRGAQTIRTETHRLIAHKGGELELYDHESSGVETRNLAKSHPAKAAALLKQLKARLN